MYGWRARIGYISAGTGEVSGEELLRAVPKGVEVLEGNLFLKGDDLKELEAVPIAVDEMARRLAERAEVDMLVLAGFLLPRLAKGGAMTEREWIARLEDLTKKPVVTGIRAQVEAMQALQCRSPLVIVPGPIEPFTGLVDYLKADGFEVAPYGMDLSTYGDPYRVPLHVSYRFAKEMFVKNPQADALLFPESTFPCAPNVQTLEKDLGVSVLLDCLCSLWACMQRLRIHEPIRGWGRLFATSKTQ